MKSSANLHSEDLYLCNDLADERIAPRILFMLCNIQEDFILFSFFLNTMTPVVLPLTLKHFWNFPFIMVFSFHANLELYLVISLTSFSFPYIFQSGQKKNLALFCEWATEKQVEYCTWWSILLHSQYINPTSISPAVKTYLSNVSKHSNKTTTWQSSWILSRSQKVPQGIQGSVAWTNFIKIPYILNWQTTCKIAGIGVSCIISSCWCSANEVYIPMEWLLHCKWGFCTSGMLQ